MLTVNVPVKLTPAEEVKTTLKEVSPCRFSASVVTGSTKYVQPLPKPTRATISLLSITPVASPQETV